MSNAPVLKFEIDKAGFPMIWVESVAMFVHWIPVTKIQYETFLCAAPDGRMGEEWYETILRLDAKTARIAPNRIRDSNYWQSFMTGVTPDEAQRYADWCGDEFSLPTLDEWMAIYRTMKDLPPATPDIFDQIPKLKKERVKTLLKRLDSETQRVFKTLQVQRSFADQMLMRQGVMEWVQCADGRWGGKGEPNRPFYGKLVDINLATPSYPTNTDDRLYYYGFRLVRRA